LIASIKLGYRKTIALRLSFRGIVILSTSILALIETVTPQQAKEKLGREEYEWIAGNSS